MPFYVEDQILEGNLPEETPKSIPSELKTPTDPVSFLDTAKAMYTEENPVFGLAKQFMQPKTSNTLDMDFRPIDELEVTRPDLIRYVDRFIEVKNNEEFNRKIFNIDFELDQKEILRNSSTPATILSALSNGMVDPVTLIPLVKVAKGASVASTAAKTALKGLGLGAVSAGIQEGILYPTSETRTLEQSATNLFITAAAGTIIGGIVGAKVANTVATDVNKKILSSILEGEDLKFVIDDFSQDMVGKVAYQQAIEEASKSVPKTDLISTKAVVSLQGDSVIRMALDQNASKLAEEIGVKAAESRLGRSVGASAVTTGTESISDANLAHINKTVAKVISGEAFWGVKELTAPELKAALSNSRTVQLLGDIFYNAPHIKKFHKDGIALGDKLESKLSRQRRDIVNISRDINKAYTEYTGKGSIRSGISFLRGEDKISFREFSAKVWDNLTNSKLVSEIPQVNAISSKLRGLMDIRVKELQDAGILSKDIDPEFLRNYMMRVYDLDKLADPATRYRLKEKITAYVMDHTEDGKPRDKSLDFDEADDIASGMLNNILKENQANSLAHITENFITKGTFLKKRSFLIPDSEIKEFLVDDGFKLFNNYMEKTGRLLALNESVQKLGPKIKTINDIQEMILRDRDAALTGITDAAEIAKIRREYIEAGKLADKMYRSAAGQIYKPGSADRFFSALSSYNYMTMLGAVTLSSLSEIMIPLFRFGLTETVLDGWIPAIRSLRTSKLAKEQLSDVTGALELKQNTMLRLLDGIEDPSLVLREQSKFELGLKTASEVFSKTTVIQDWTAMGKGISGQISSARLARIFKSGKEAENVELLASLGIDKNMYGRISAQMKHVQKTRGTYIINPHLWDDEEALNVFKSAVQTDIDATILMPGIGTQPFFAQETALGKILFQFSTFMNTATSRLVISGIQRRDSAVLSGVIGLTVMGGLVQMLKDELAGRDIDTTPERFILNGLSQSGVLGLLGTRSIDLYRTMQDPTTSRYLDSTIEGMILGPSAGQIGKATRMLQGVTDGDVTDKDINRAIKMLPYSNLFYISPLINQAFPNE